MKLSILWMVVTLCSAGLAWPQDLGTESSAQAGLHCIDPQSPQGLRELLHHDGHRLPVVSAHRGGSGAGFPENCIKTFTATLRQSFALLEIDPRYTRDGEIVILHDATLDRTTTGKGPLNSHTFEQLKQFRLKDSHGEVTEDPIPTLDEVLEWARGKTVLILDQKDVTVADRVGKIQQHKAEGYAMMIVYSFEEARACYALNPQIMMEVMIPNRAKVEEFDATGVPWQNIVAFVGHNPPVDVGLYEMIHRKGAMCIVGSSRNHDRKLVELPLAEHSSLKPAYDEFLQRGADLIETDLPRQVGPLLYAGQNIPITKSKYFVRR